MIISSLWGGGSAWGFCPLSVYLFVPLYVCSDARAPVPGKYLQQHKGFGESFSKCDCSRVLSTASWHLVPKAIVAMVKLGLSKRGAGQPGLGSGGPGGGW